MTIGILAAMHDEVADLIGAMIKQSGNQVHRIGMRDYHVGKLDGQSCVVVLARIGKVAAAATAVTLIREFDVTEVIFTGLAGGIGRDVAIGNIVIADRSVQHDMDVRPLFPHHEIPLLGRSEFATDIALSAELKVATELFLKEDFQQSVAPEVREAFGIKQPVLHIGLIASGDQFVADVERANGILADFPQALAVEMEGAAVAQICFEYDVPCAILRTISDRADASAHGDFGAFLAGVASHYSAGVLRRFFSGRRDEEQINRRG
ncbi:5'-methylthioadenosine/adenosylhomocysteine nucleosidase [Glaciimonas immobilis]|uniref:adenosylhomocysteine nucleosidase n=1 Tax=Glaciimonas immobilis TaxID=728004 RepID=A0A840RS57_9BURK|nr:5'-methylthioadenosine/adenosylhomocysteine nucleosidase [Glaciimonas immobilis]KAF3997834.1 5'-methylthioadenosine/adenosylhomocysteine nucleosidase [Glaciimonas immobilis]MBB5199534.1 adenosylhomocysteine nucleosidase [Glaciimonas immobilis]